VYRVAHNVAASHVIRERRRNTRILIGLEELENLPAPKGGEQALDEHHALETPLQLVEQLKPLDRQVIVSYLEGLDASSIAEITGLSANNVSTKVHRIKNVLARQFHKGGNHAE
jgi:RNA polymerase sigma-70 factor, ECF subfamily